MFSFFKKKNNLPPVPKWASFFDPSEYQVFTEALQKYMSEKKLVYVPGEGAIEIISKNEYGFTTLGLLNVAQSCKQVAKRDYAAMVRNHFESLLRTKKFEVYFKEIVGDFEKVKEYIGVRIYSQEYIDYIGTKNTLGKELTDDTRAILIFDLPDSIINIRPEEAAPWNISLDALFETGFRNTKKNCPLQLSLEKIGGLGVYFIQAEHYFAANILLDLPAHPQLLGSKGALVGIPNRHVAIIYPVENTDVVLAVNKLIPAIHGLWQKGPGSISDHLSWYNNGKFENLPYQLDENKLRFTPPASFVELLNSFR